MRAVLGVSDWCLERRLAGIAGLTGNDLAIDMVMYGSDYLLGLATFAPDVFAERDRLWALGDPGFYELNDTLQYLGQFAFRPPVPAYRHSAAMFLELYRCGFLPRILRWFAGILAGPRCLELAVALAATAIPDSNRGVVRLVGV